MASSSSRSDFKLILPETFQLQISKVTEDSLKYGSEICERSKNTQEDLLRIFLSMQKGFWDVDPEHPQFRSSIVFVSPTVFPGSFEVQPRDVLDGSDVRFAEEFRNAVNKFDGNLRPWLCEVLNRGLVKIERGRNRLAVRLFYSLPYRHYSSFF